MPLTGDIFTTVLSGCREISVSVGLEAYGNWSPAPSAGPEVWRGQHPFRVGTAQSIECWSFLY